MAQYQYSAPDGKVHLFKGPDGLTPQDVELFGDNYFGIDKSPKPIPVEAKPETGFIPSIKRSTTQLGSLFGDIIPAMAAHAVGAEDYAKRQLEEAQKTQEEIQKKYPAEVPSYKDIKDVGTGLKYIVESVGEAIPSILPSLFTGGVASLAGRAAIEAAKDAAESVILKESAGVATEALKNKAIEAGTKAARNVALKYEATGALAGSAAQNIPDVYQNIYQETGKQDLGASLAFGGFNSLLDAATPLMLMRKIKTAGIPEEQVIGAWYKRAGKGALEGLATEGGTEALQEISSAAAESFVDQHKEFFTKENFERFVNAGLKGGLGGAALTSATNVAFGRSPEKQISPEQLLQQVGTETPVPTDTTQTPIKDLGTYQKVLPTGEIPGFKILEQKEAEAQPPATPALTPAPTTELNVTDTSPTVNRVVQGMRGILAGNPNLTDKQLVDAFTEKTGTKPSLRFAKEAIRLGPIQPTEVPNAQPVAEPAGTSVPVPSGTDTNVAPAGGVGRPEAPGVVSAGENVPSAVAGEAKQQAPIKEVQPKKLSEMTSEQLKESFAQPPEVKKLTEEQKTNLIDHFNNNKKLTNEEIISDLLEPVEYQNPETDAITLGSPVLSPANVNEAKEFLNTLKREEPKVEGEPSVTETPEAKQAEEERPKEEPAPEPVTHTQDQIDDYEATRDEHNKNNSERPIPEFNKLTAEQKQAFFDATPNNSANEQDIAAGQLADQIHGRPASKTQPLPQNVATMTQAIEAMRFGKNPFHKAVAQLLRKAKLKTKLELVPRLDGRLAEYDPKTDTVRAIKEGLNAETLLHEMSHAATVKVIYAYENDLPLTDKQEMAVIHLEYLMEESKKKLAGKYPEAYKDLYEFVAHAMNDEAFVDELKQIPIAKKDSIYDTKSNFFTDFIRSIAQALGLVDDQSNFAAEAFRAFEDIIAPPPKEGIEMAPLPMETKQAEPGPKTDKEILDAALTQVRPMVQTRNVKSSVRNLFTLRGAQWLADRFQNDRYALKVAEDRGVLFGLVERLGDKLNNVYGQITRSSGIAVDLFNIHMKFPVQDAQNAVEAYAKRRGIDTKEALAELHLILETRHEPERRRVLYMMNVPLDASKPSFEFYGKQYTAYGFRDEVMRLLANPAEMEKNGITVKHLRDAMHFITNDVQNNPNSVYRAKEIAVEKKRGGTEYKPTQESDFDINNHKYNVIAGRSPQEINIINKSLDKPEYAKEINEVARTIKAVQEKTKDLNKIANYQSKPVSNIIDFYNFQNYVPFKGRPGSITKAAEELDFDSKNLGGEMQDAQDRMEGRLSESENAILQSLADGATSALRAGRKDLTLAIKNAIAKDVRILQGKVVDRIKFDERFRGTINKQSITGEDKIFHYNDDGTIDVIQVTEKRQSEAIRRSYRQSQPVMDAINNLTSGIGQTHTRYNPAFAPMNFVRDAFTNAFTIGAELGPARAGKLLSAISSEVASGGMGKSLRYSNLYANGKFEEIERLTKQDPYYRDLHDYVQAGGRVSYLQGVAAKGALDQLIKEVGRSGILKKKEQIDKFIDIYNDMFELSSRVASYRFLKEEFTKDNVANKMPLDKARADAKIRAVEYTKNLANFEQVGRWGKNAGALYMFFRPAATGAVRAIEALAPAFMPINEAQFRRDNEGMGKEKIDRALASMKERQRNARVMAASLAGVGVGMYLMAMMMAGDDDQGRNKVLTDDMTRWTRYARFFIPGTDTIIQIPWGFGLGAFASAGAQVAGMFAGRGSIADGLSNIVNAGLDSFLPFPVSNIDKIENFPAWALDSATPSAVRPFLEYVMNLDGLGREIYNNKQTKYGDAYTGGDNIPELYKYAARTLFEATNGAVDWSPNTMYFFASNYADGVAKALTGATNLGLTLTGQKDVDLKNDTLFLSSFLGTKSNVDAREFSQAENKIKGLEKRVNSIKDDPEQLSKFLDTHSSDYYLVQYYNKEVNGTLRSLRTAANQIRTSKTLSIKERKEQLDEIVKAENMVKRNLLENFKLIQEQNI
jgi:hypothetical protein